MGEFVKELVKHEIEFKIDHQVFDEGQVRITLSKDDQHSHYIMDLDFTPNINESIIFCLDDFLARLED